MNKTKMWHREEVFCSDQWTNGFQVINELAIRPTSSLFVASGIVGLDKEKGRRACRFLGEDGVRGSYHAESIFTVVQDNSYGESTWHQSSSKPWYL